jgi:hypothetical protein
MPSEQTQAAAHEWLDKWIVAPVVRLVTWFLP